jgi:HK97 family phage portal protein
MSLFNRVKKRLDGAKKAISHHPELADRVHIHRSGGQQLAEFNPNNYMAWAKVYNSYPWLYRAASVIAQNIAPLRVRVVDGAGEEVEGHAITKLFNSGNESTPMDDIWRMSIIDLMLAGEFFHEFVEDASGMPVELWRRRPDFVGVIPDASNPSFPIKAGYVVSETDLQPVPLAPNMMFQFKFSNPTNPWRGLAPVNAIRDNVSIDVLTTAWSRNFMQAGARPDYALVAPAGITTSERESYEETLMRKFGGVDNAGKPIILEDGVTDIKVLNWSPSDVQWLDQREYSRDVVGAIMGVPDLIMGYGTEQYDNSDKMNAHLKAFWVMTLKPIVEAIDSALTHYFTMTRQLLADGQRVEHDLSMVGALQDDITPMVDNAFKLSRMGVPFNDIDERLGMGFGEVVGGSEPYQPTQGQQVEAADSTRSFFKSRHDLPQFDESEADALREDGEAALIKELQWQLDHITEGLTEFNAAAMALKLNDRIVITRLLSLWQTLLTQWVDVGAGFGQSVVNAGVDGTGFIAIDWSLANQEAVKWARAHAGTVADQMTATSLKLVRDAVASWIEDGGTIGDLTATLSAPSMFGSARASRAAVTEVTRSLAEGSIISYKNSAGAVKGTTWQTNMDGLVCKICAPLNGENRMFNEAFDDVGTIAPPAHVGCRCWVLPWVAL